MKIKLLAMDVDGTLTDGRIYIGSTGEVMKAFDVKDGYAIAQMLPAMGITPAIITARQSEIAARRAEEICVAHLYQGVSDKRKKLEELINLLDLNPDEVAFIGDDLGDLSCIAYCGCSACPADAVQEVKAQVGYVCQKEGGRGAVREFVDYLREKAAKFDEK